MRKFTSFIKTLFIAVLGLAVSQVWSQATFVPNQGQWEGDFLFKTDLSNGAIFFQEEGYTMLLIDPEALESMHVHGDDHGHGHHHHDEEHDGVFESFAYRMSWLNTSSTTKQLDGFSEQPYYKNYLLGNDPTNWQGQVPVFQGMQHKGLYPGVTVNYYEDQGSLKYDLLLKDGADPSLIKMRYEGLQGLIIHEGRLVLKTSLGDLWEYIPEAYQIVNGEKVLVSCSYSLDGNTVGFDLGYYNPSLPLVIDPVLDFSTFTGSTADNWGFTATYDNSGNFYAGGIAFSTGYPISVGAFSGTFGGGDFDASISKFSSDGVNLVYSTLIGGNDLDIPHSMVVDDQDQLVILGSTGSTDFPMNAGAFESNFILGPPVGFPRTAPGSPVPFTYNNGANAFVFKLNATGSAMASSTFLSAREAVGTNIKVFQNYGDNSRGEVIMLDNGNIAIVTSTMSDSLPLSSVGGPVDPNVQNAVVAVFNPGLTQMIWGSYYGGSGNETGYSVKTDGTDVFICGATNSNDLTTHATSYEDSHQGANDGYIARFNGATGQFLGALYLGTSTDDQAFFIDVDKLGSIFVFGQSKGNMPVTNGPYSNPGSRQFLQKYSADLNTLVWSTVIGSGQAKTDLVPTAFMVDKCLNIYMSGWNGTSNRVNGGFNGNTQNLVTSSDAFDSTSDGSDFYFMVLGRDASSFLYGTYFGGTADEHVDGGTSRFSPDGIIYQAVCAACAQGSFPTTSGVYSPTRNSTNCNFGAIKISLEQTVKSVPEIDLAVDVDTVCDRLNVKFTNNSRWANRYYWDFGNGLTSTLFEPSTTFDGLGQYTITLVAEDTVCDISDTATIEIDHNFVKRPTAAINVNYIGCDKTFEVNFSNASNEVNRFEWDFGDGNFSNLENPTHNFADSGVYQIRLIAYDSLCQLSDTVYATVEFSDTSVTPRSDVAYKQCSAGEVTIVHTNYRARYSYHWQYDGKKAVGAQPDIRFESPGFYNVDLEIKDPVCSNLYQQEFFVEIEEIQQEVYIPNAFSPNDDGINEEFMLSGDACGVDDYFKIFNRWGEIVFQTDRPFVEFWDGTNQGEPAKEDVYTYSLKTGKEIKKGYLTLFR